MKAIMLTMRLYYFYLTYKGIKSVDVRKTKPISNYLDGKSNSEVKRPIDVYECVSRTNWKQDLMKIPKDEREFFAKFVGKVGLRFTLNKVEKIHSYLEPEQWYKTNDTSGSDLMKKSCLSFKELDDYLLSGCGYAWHVDDLLTYDTPREISDFKAYIGAREISVKKYSTKEIIITYGKPLKSLTRVPQSWCYVEV